MLLSILLTFIAAICITGLLGLGILLIWKGLCGKIVDRHPLCNNCKFDLVGHSPRPAHCPECGAIIARIGSIQIGNRKRQFPKILHGSTLMVVNISFIGLCWWSAEQPAKATIITLAPPYQVIPISLPVPKAIENTDNSISVVDVPATTTAINIKAIFSRNLIILGDYNSLENSITTDQLLLLDKQSRLNLPMQPASGVIESFINQGKTGKPFRAIHSNYGTARKNLSQRGR